MTDQANEGLLSPFLQRRRISAAVPYLRGRVLDIGCGSGALAEFVDPAQYLGIDCDAVSLRLARKNFPRYEFQTNNPEASMEFDTIVALAIIEHVENPGKFLKDLASLLSMVQA